MLFQSFNSVGSNRFECKHYIDFHFVPHIHKHFELVYVVSGEIILFVGDRKETLSEGMYALIFPNQIHSYSTLVSSYVSVCVFSEDLIAKFSKETKELIGTQSSFICEKSTNDYLVPRLFETTSPPIYIIKSCLYAICYEFLNQVKLVKKAEGEDILMLNMLTYITKNYTENITLGSLSTALGYEKHYISRFFHQNIHMNYKTFINNYRVEHATNLLLHSDLSITEIAMASGFQSVRSFNRVFKEITGKEPRNIT